MRVILSTTDSSARAGGADAASRSGINSATTATKPDLRTGWLEGDGSGGRLRPCYHDSPRGPGGFAGNWGIVIGDGARVRDRVIRGLGMVVALIVASGWVLTRF